MSFNLRNIREISNEPLSKFVSHLAYRIAKLANDQQTQELENKEDIYSAGQDVDSALKLHSFNSTKSFDLQTEYFPPTEPDLDLNTIWIQGYNMGNYARDISGFENVCTINGDPILIDGEPFDYGIHTGGTKSIALRFNRVSASGIDHSDNDTSLYYPEYISIDHDQRISLDGSTSMSWFFRVRPLSTNTHEGTLRTIYCKTDVLGANSNGEIDDAARFSIDNVDKRLIIRIKRTTFYSKKTAANAMEEGNVYDVFVTFNAGTIKCYMAKITAGGVADSSPTDMTLTDSSYTEEWGDNLADNSARLMKRGAGSESGAFHGDLFDFKIYRNHTVNFDSHGSSLFLDGTNDYVNCGNHTDLWSKALSKFSFSIWIYPTVLSGGFDRVVIDHGSGSNQGFGFDIDNPTDVARFRIKAAGGGNNDATSTALTVNAWNNVIGTYDNSLGSANVKIFVNNVQGGTTASLTETINLSANLELASPSNDFQGYMRDFRFWDTIALDSTQRTNVINNSVLAPSPNYRLRLTEGSGTPTDIISQTKTATLNNGATLINDEVGNHWKNKWTIADIPYGQVMIANYYSPFNQVIVSPTGGYSATGYDSTGFDTDV